MNFIKVQKSNELSNLVALGCAFYEQPNDTIVDLEKVILDGLSYFWSDKALFDMLIGLLEHRLHALVNIDRLIMIANKDVLDERNWILLALAHRLKTIDRRFTAIIKHVRKRHIKKFNIPEFYSLPRLKKLKRDPNFKKVGIDVPDFFGEKESKFFDLDVILKMNPWLRVRSLIGPTYRADIAFMKSIGKISSAKDAVHVLGCQRATARRIWNAISVTPFLEPSDFFTKITLPKIFSIAETHK